MKNYVLILLFVVFSYKAVNAIEVLPGYRNDLCCTDSGVCVGFVKQNVDPVQL